MKVKAVEKLLKFDKNSAGVYRPAGLFMHFYSNTFQHWYKYNKKFG